jgi:hypothetical protein
VVDGNFSAEQMKMRNGVDDVPLTDGNGYMCTLQPFLHHISKSVDKKEVHINLYASNV